jgi:hypothetical protein
MAFIGLEAATGDLIIYIDADERRHAACGGTLRRTIEQAPRRVFAAPRAIRNRGDASL